jgi:hypothetical protein
MKKEVGLDRLLGRRVHDVEGAVVGRLEEVRAEKARDGWCVAEYLIGPAGLRERLSAGILGRLHGARRGYRARWDQLDISDPEHLRLSCRADELERYAG